MTVWANNNLLHVRQKALAKKCLKDILIVIERGELLKALYFFLAVTIAIFTANFIIVSAESNLKL
ncbi:MAG TPA: hypothetical protein VER14_00270, partial [Phototrophicaceae bacterium]|nr:hypothetical protein [Phototrophicaceae bacterium]